MLENNRVNLKIENDIAYVTLNNPEKKNALDYGVINGLIEAAAKIKQDRTIRAVILQGAGEDFSAGLDIKSIMREPKRAIWNLLKFVRKDNLFQRCTLVWRELPIPVIAAVRGYCLGGGLQIIMAADFRVAAPNAKFSIMEAKWGLVPDMSALLSFPETAQLDHIKYLTMTAKIFDANEAKDYGLLTAVADDPLAQAHMWIDELKQKSPDSVVLSKKLLNKTWKQSSVRKVLFWETWYQLRAFLSKNHRIAIARESGKDKAYLPRKIK